MKVLSYLSEFLIPILIFYIVAMGVCAKRNVYKDFMNGAGEGLGMVVKIMPTIDGGGNCASSFRIFRVCGRTAWAFGRENSFPGTAGSLSDHQNVFRIWCNRPSFRSV